MEEYGQLEKIIDETIQQSSAKGQINLNAFVKQMDEEFQKLGYHDDTNKPVENIFISRLDGVGDFILNVPAIRAIRENFPDAKILLVVSQRIYPVAELCPYVDEILVYDTSIEGKGILGILRGVADFAKKNLWQRRFDLSFDFLSDYRHLFMSYLSGARERVGYFNETGNQLSLKKLFTNRAIFLDKTKFTHWVERNLYLLKSIGLKVNSDDIEVWFSDNDLNKAKEILKDFAPDRVKIAVGIGAATPERHYPLEKYLVAFKEIIAKGAALVLLGGPAEVDDAKFLEDNLPKEFVKNVVPIKTGWQIDTAIISQIDMYIGNDTGTQHVSAAFKKPVVTLSRDSKDLTRALNYDCEHMVFHAWKTKAIVLLPEHSLDTCAELRATCWAGKPHCITQIDPAEIVDAYDKMINDIDSVEVYSGGKVVKSGKYGQLEKIVDSSIIKALATKGFNATEFFQQMEDEFTRLGFRDKPTKAVENILLIRIDAVGDFVLTSAAIREVRMNYPSAFITLIVSKVVYPLAEHCPYVNEVLIFDAPPDAKVTEALINVTKFAAANLWKRRYSLCFCFRYWMNNTTWALAYMSGAAKRVGYSGHANNQYKGENPLPKKNIYGLAFTHVVVQPKEILQDTARNLYMLQSFGLQVHRTDLEVWFDNDDLQAAKEILAGFAPNRLKVAVGIGAGRIERKYPVEKYLVAFKEIINEGASLVILGGTDEVDDAKFLEDNLPREFVKNVVELKPSWQITAALISETFMYIGNDTGTQHISAALKNPTVVLSPESLRNETIFDGGFCQCAQYYPWQTMTILLRPEKQIDDCAKALYYGGCKAGKPHCIAQIEPADIVHAYDNIIFALKHSGIKKISCPQLLNGTDKVTPLHYGFEFDKI